MPWLMRCEGLKMSNFIDIRKLSYLYCCTLDFRLFELIVCSEYS